jgi:chromosome segregation ATPase
MATPRTLTLQELLCDDDIQSLKPYWKDLGRQLGVSESDINIIAYNCRNEPDQCTACTTEVLNKRLEILPLDWKEVNDAVRDVKSRKEADKRLQQHKLSIEREQKEVITAIDKLKTSMDGLDGRNEEIAKNMANLNKELEVEMASQSPLKIQWQREDEEWQRGAKRRQQIRTAINERNFKESQFVKDFLQRNSTPEDLTEEEIEGYLRQNLLTEEENRSQQLRIQFHKVRIHHKNLKHLLKKIHELKHLIEDRLHDAYAVILKSLEDVGLKNEKIKDLQEKLEILNKTIQDCEQGVKECNKQITNGRRNLTEFKNELKSFLKPFHEVIKGMHNVTTSLENEEHDLERDLKKKQSEYKRYEEQVRMGVAVGGVTGLAAGAVFGSIIFPVVGTAVGGVAGYLCANIDTSILDRTKLELKRAEMKLNRKRSILRTFKTTEDIGEKEVEELKKLINESL